VLRKRLAKHFRLGRSCRYESMPNEREPERTSLLAASMSSKIKGEGRRGRMKNYGMGRRDCAEFKHCPKRIKFDPICVAALQLRSSLVTFGFAGTSTAIYRSTRRALTSPPNRFPRRFP